MQSQFDPALSWDDVEWLRSIWDGPIVLKGIQTVADAKQAVDVGRRRRSRCRTTAAANSTTRPTPIELLEPVAQEVGGQIAIICDGGIRRGSDIVKALALGADACSAGRAYLYALGAAGERGSTTCSRSCSTA